MRAKRKLFISSLRFEAGRSPETREIVTDDRPGGAIVEVEVRLRKPVDGAVHVRERNVDDFGMPTRYAEERGAAATAKRAAAVLRRLVARELIAAAIDRS